MKRGRIQAKDIDDVEFLLTVRRVQLRRQRRMVRGYRREGRGDLVRFYREYLPWATWGAYDALDDSPEAVKFRREWGPFVNGYFPGVPNKVLRAKGQRLIDRGLLDGCMCGCRGDMELTAEGLQLVLASASIGRVPG